MNDNLRHRIIIALFAAGLVAVVAMPWVVAGPGIQTQPGVSAGKPGAAAVPNWYVDSVQGNDANDCQAAGAGHACATIEEIIRRIGTQAISVPSGPTIFITGDFSALSHTFAVPSPAAGSVAPTVIGTRTYTTADGGTLGQWTITYVSWDAGAHQEGTVTLTPIDGGGAFPASYNTPEAGIWLEDTTGPNAGLGIIIGPQIDAGEFLTSGGTIPGSFAGLEPTTGDSVRAFTLTPVSTAPGTIAIVGDFGWYFQNVQLGAPTQHSTRISNGGGGTNIAIFDTCLLGGPDLTVGSAQLNGSAWKAGVRVYGYFEVNNGTGDYIEARGQSGNVVTLSNTLLFPVGPFVSTLELGTDGPGHLLALGPIAVESYSTPAFLVENGSSAWLQAPIWARNSVSSALALQVFTGAVGVTYTSGMAPAAVGTAPGSPFKVGGTATSSLPATTNGVSVQVSQ